MDNPMGTDGFEFVEYSAPDPALLRRVFAALGFPVVARHRSKDVTRHRQGDVNFIVNAETDSFAQRFAREHGPSACAIAGIGGSLLYLVDRVGDRTIYDIDFRPVAAPPPAAPVGLLEIDHLTHEEYLREYRGEGIQHIALSTGDIVATVDALRGRGVEFQDTPAAYYDGVDARVPGHGEDLCALRERGTLVDGNPRTGEGVLLQIFTRNMIGPIFFEVIQRKGNQGFGEGNFKALFESIEFDQMRRGVI